MKQNRILVPVKIPRNPKLEEQQKKIETLVVKLLKPIMQLPKEERENSIKQLEGKLINSQITDKII